jgi:non-ribosomal peptide synthetase component F
MSSKIQLSEATTSALKTLAQQHQLTLNTLVQGAFALLLVVTVARKTSYLGRLLLGVRQI